jgi:hypothetical protein
VDGRSPVVTPEEGFDGVDRDKPATADLDRAELAGADELVEGGAGEAARRHRLVYQIGAAVAVALGICGLHRVLVSW